MYMLLLNIIDFDHHLENRITAQFAPKNSVSGSNMVIVTALHKHKNNNNNSIVGDDRPE